MTSPEAGYSLPLVLVIALVLIGGASALVARSSSGVLGGIFQKQSLEARGLAELGMATLVSRLNKEENRYLMAAPAKDLAPNYSRETLWSNDSSVLAANHTNPCADTYVTSPTTGLQIKQATPPQINNIYPAGNASGWWYVDAAGRVSTSQANAIGKFRLIANSLLNPGGNFRLGIIKDSSLNPPEELDFTKAQGKSSIKLSVEAIALNANGSDKARAVLEQVLDLVPKCCRTTFGNEHGNNDYRSAYDPDDPYNPFGASTCDPRIDPDSFGLVFGIRGDGGRMNNTGNATEIWRREDDGSKTPINPVGCIQLGTTPCQIEGTFNGISGSNTSELLEVLNTRMPAAPEWYPGRPSGSPMPAFLALGATTSTGRSICGSATASTPNGTNPDCVNLNDLPPKLKDKAGRNANPATTPFFRYCLDNTCTRTFINGNAQDVLTDPPLNPPPQILPPHCKRAPAPPTGDGALHCVASKLDLGNGSNKLQFVTGVMETDRTITIRPIRVYFPKPSTDRSDYIIDQGGSAWVEHCVVATSDPGQNPASCRGMNTDYKERITQLSFFGCNTGSIYYGVTCGPQYFKLQGNASTLGYFSYFPDGNIELQGNADVEGVIWTNNLASTGSGDFIVPASGVMEVFELLGINPGTSNNCSASIYGACPQTWQPKWDFVARSVRRFSFKYG